MAIPANIRVQVNVPFPAQVVGSGGIGVQKGNGIWTIFPNFGGLSLITGPSLTDPSLKQIWIFDPSTGVYNTMTLAGLGDALYKLTSTTSLAIGTGSKTFVTQKNKDIGVGSWVIAASDSGPANFMLGQVTSYDASGNLTISVSASGVGGTGTKTDWTLRASGPPGTQGKSAGLSYAWSTNTAATDPGAGVIKANNATFGSITALYISETDADTNAIAAELATWGVGTSTVKGRIKIYDPLLPVNFMNFDVTAFADSGTFDTLTVTPISSGGTFTNVEVLRVAFTPKGDKGDQGIPGAGTVAGLTTHGVVIATGAAAVGNTVVLTDGQLVVGATGADPTAKTLSGDATLAATGALTLANSGTTRTHLGLAIGTDVQAFDAQLSSLVRQNSQSVNYTTVAADSGKHIYHPNTDTTARTFTIDSNANVPYPIGTVITFVNDTSGGGVITIALTADTLVFAPSGTTGSRTLAVCGVATAIKVNSTRWVISGTGLT